LAASASKGRVEVLALSPEVPDDDSGTWVPATGGSFTLCFLGQPANNAAALISSAIDKTLFIDLSILRSKLLNAEW
jgi:hypothetical protein